jgi:type IV secretory pathway TrbL component
MTCGGLVAENVEPSGYTTKELVNCLLCFMYTTLFIYVSRHLQGNGIQMIEAMAFYGLSSLILL